MGFQLWLGELAEHHYNIMTVTDLGKWSLLIRCTNCLTAVSFKPLNYS